MDRLNIEVNSTPSRVGRYLRILWEMIAEIARSSPMALGKGGRPRFAQAKISQSEGSRV